MSKNENIVSEDEKWFYQDPQGRLQGNIYLRLYYINA